MTIRQALLGGVMGGFALVAGAVSAQQSDTPTAADIIDALKYEDGDSDGMRVKDGGRGLSLGTGAASGSSSSAGATAAAASVGAATAQTEAPSMSFQVEFAFASAELDPTARALLDELGTALASQQLAPYRFRLTGHTDAVGEEGYNKGLSERRARAVREYLVSKFSISRERLDSVGMGESRLLDQDRPDAAVNRRVEITNIGLVDG